MTEAEAAKRCVELLTYDGPVCHLYRAPGGGLAVPDTTPCKLCGKSFLDMRLEPARVSVMVFRADADDEWRTAKMWCDGRERKTT